jgi:CheY-like chemotaxis protein
MKVLLVEDDALSRMVMTEMVKMGGYELVAAETGAEAVEMAAAEDVALILLDNRLPDGAGADFFVAIRNAEQAAGRAPRPVIAVTGDAFPEDQKRFLDLGYTGYLSKPVSLPDLHTMLAKHFPGGAASS